MRRSLSVLAALTLVASGSAAWAQTTPRFLVSCVPGPNCVSNQIEFSVVPKRTATVSLKIENLDATRSIEMTVDFRGRAGPVSPAWYTATPSQGIHIPPGGREYVLITLNVPENTATFTRGGANVRVILWRYTDQVTGGSIIIRVAVGMLMWLTVRPPFENDWYSIESPVDP